jgi:serine phosphatase RsbU (regulator of sigma subunit)
LGDLKDPEFSVHKQQLSNTDSVIFLTDGLLAQRDASGDAYGYRRFHKLLKSQVSIEPKEISTAVLAGIVAHSADEILRDDQALLVVKWA